jgi:hypothetical protein
MCGEATASSSLARCPAGPAGPCLEPGPFHLRSTSLGGPLAASALHVPTHSAERQRPRSPQLRSVQARQAHSVQPPRALHHPPSCMLMHELPSARSARSSAKCPMGEAGELATNMRLQRDGRGRGVVRRGPLHWSRYGRLSRAAAHPASRRALPLLCGVWSCACLCVIFGLTRVSARPAMPSRYGPASPACCTSTVCRAAPHDRLPAPCAHPDLSRRAVQRMVCRDPDPDR